MDQSIQPNPLSKYFRQPAIHIKLPSNGAFWPAGSLNMPVTNELPVYPMTAADEITLKTPDALMNGQGVVSVIKSCCPNIIDPWQMPAIDVDAILLAVRIASFGNMMEFSTKCPECDNENTYEFALDGLLSTIVTPDYVTPVDVNGLKIQLRPQSYKSINEASMIDFEEQRILQTITNSELSDEERQKQFDEHLRRLVNINIKVIANCAESVTTPEGEVVTNPAVIYEFLNNTDSKVIKAIQSRLAINRDAISMKPQDVKCTNCEHEYKIPLVFDYSHFFG